ncbi:MAG: hypothetical protein GX303_02940 [Clostridiales bacterium]|nr:hypothetical protein [Clostridiales bacterium]
MRYSRIIKKGVLLLIFGCLFAVLLTICGQASDGGGGEEYLDSLKSLIPDDIRGQLPDNLLEGEEGTSSEAIAQLVGFDYLAAKALDALVAAAKASLGSLSMILGILILSSVFNLFRGGIHNDGLSKIVELACSLCVALSIFSFMNGQLETVSETIERINVFMTGLLPVMGGLYAAGGNVASAVAANAGLMTFVTVIENICYYALVPLLRICFGFAIVSVFCVEIDLSEVSNLIKKTYTILIVFLTTLMSAVFAYQSAIANSADNVAAKTAKFAVGSFVPVVGSALGEAIKTVAGSLTLIKNMVGVVAVVVIILSAMPAFFSLLMGKLALGISGAVAGLLGSTRENRLINELKGIYNLGLAMVACTSVLFLVCLTVFIKCTVALGT